MEKKFNYKRIVAIVSVLLVWTAILLIFVDSKPMYGKWNCGSDIAIEFSRTRSFEVYNTKNKDEIYKEGSFKAKRQKVSLPKIKYNVVLELEEKDDNFPMKLEISLKQTKLNEMTIKKIATNEKYTCKRAK